MVFGLDSPERHLTRVAARVARVARGGHNIPEDKIRARYDASRQNLIALMEYVTLLQVYDNSAEQDPLTGKVPVPTLLLEVCGRLLRFPSTGQELARTPPWAKALVAKAYPMFVR